MCRRNGAWKCVEEAVCEARVAADAEAPVYPDQSSPDWTAASLTASLAREMSSVDSCPRSLSQHER